MIGLILGTPALGAEMAYFMREDATAGKQIWEMDLKTGASRPVTSGASWHLYPEASADGKQLAYVEGDGAAGNLAVIVQQLGSGRRERWSAPSGMHLHPSLSGDGHWLAYSGPLGPLGQERIGIVHLKKARELSSGTPEKTPEGELWHYSAEPRVLESEGRAFFPAFSSDGSFIVFQRTQPNGAKDIVEVNLSSGKLRQLTPQDGKSMAPELSADDRWVAYTSQADGNWDVYLLDRRSGASRRITTDPAQDFAPAFAPNGDILFASNRGGQFAIYRARLGEGEQVAEELLSSVAEADLYAPSATGELGYAQAILPRMPEPARSSFGAIEHQGRIYIAGGHQGPEHTYPPGSFIAKLEYYDLKTGQWHEGAPRQVASQGFELVAYGDYLYAFGGFAYSAGHKPGWRSLDVIERYSIRENRWEVIGKMPRKRSSHVAVQLGSKVYLIGGWDATPKHENDLEGHFHREIDVFDLETEAMVETEHRLPDPLRRAFTGVELNGKILLLGGIGVGSSHFDLLDQVTEFDPVTGAWRELPRLPFATFAPAAGVIGQELYVFGGMFRHSQWEFSYVNHIFSLAQGSSQWRHTGRHLSETKGFAMVVQLSPTTLGILGGHSYENSDAPVATFESFSRLD